MAFNWKRENVEKLILSVQQYPCLYSVRSAEYVNRLKKSQAFNNVLEELSKSESSITLDDIKRKWSVLRNQFMRERRLIKNSKKSGSGIHDIYVPKLWCFELLGFLQSHIDMRATIDNTEVESEENIFPESSDDTTFIEEEPRKRANDSSNSIEAFRSNLDDFKNVLMQRREPKKFAWLGNLVASQMEKIKLEDQEDAAWQVQCLMRRLTSNSIRKHSSSTSSSKDILELSIEGLFDDEVFQ